MNLVVDCSFIISSILPDELNIKVEKAYSDIVRKKYQVYVPSLFYLECNNVLFEAVKRKRINNADYDEYLKILEQLPFIVDRFSSQSESIRFISNLSQNYDLTSYDASYLELALRINAHMATLDKRLIHSAKLAKIVCII